MGTVYDQHAVQMVNLMLDKRRGIPLEIRRVLYSLEVLIPDPYAIGAGDPGQEVR